MIEVLPLMIFAHAGLHCRDVLKLLPIQVRGSHSQPRHARSQPIRERVEVRVHRTTHHTHREVINAAPSFPQIVQRYSHVNSSPQYDTAGNERATLLFFISVCLRINVHARSPDLQTDLELVAQVISMSG